MEYGAGQNDGHENETETDAAKYGQQAAWRIGCGLIHVLYFPAPQTVPVL